MRCVLVGFGEIGKGVKRVYGIKHTIAVYDPITQPVMPATHEPYDLLLVAIPHSEAFIEQVRGYQRAFGVKATLVFSTTPVGTCRRLGAVHCPIEGRHPDLAESIAVTERWLGGADPTVFEFFTEAKMPYRMLPSPEHTEFLKLRSTTVYGVNIEFARYCKAVCDDIGMDYAECKAWDAWYNRLYGEYFRQPQFTRPLLDPPTGAKGGHCVTPNARILMEQYPSPLVASVAEVTYRKELGW